jgi:ferredoxin
MSALVDSSLLTDIKKFGAADVSACFSCGNCTAICPLSSNDGTFPRRMIRYAQVGMKDALLSSKELWTCYHCGMCSDSCPTQADPGGFMAAARRYAIASYDHTRLAWAMYTQPVLSTILAVLLAAFFAIFMYSEHGVQSHTSMALFGFIPEPLIHYTGLVVMVLAFLAGVSGIVTMVHGLKQREHKLRGDSSVSGWRALWSSIGVESIGQKRYRDDCATAQVQKPWYRKRWFIHSMTMYGFLGLLIATVVDYGLSLIGVKMPGTPVAIWYPTRLLGTLAGLAMIYGVTMFFVDRFTKDNQSAKNSHDSDWMFLTLLWIVGVTGFLIEISLYLPSPPTWGYWVFLFHVSVAMELILLAPFMKFAHAIYRPVALYYLAKAGGTTQEN